MIKRYGWFPRIKVKEGCNVAQNNILGITIDPKFDLYAGVLAEERREFSYTWIRLILITLCIGLPGYFLHPILPLIALIIAVLYLAMPATNRDLEATGHACYCSAGSQMYGIPLERLIDDSVTSLHTDRIYPFFHDESVEQTRARIIKKMSRANSWVFNHMPQLARDVRFIKENFDANS